MISVRHIVLGLSGALLLSGCFEKEEPIDPYPRGDIEQLSMELGSKYTHQIFYDFQQNAVVKTVDRNSWDFAYSSEIGNSTIYLNTGNNVYAAYASTNDLSLVTDTAGLNWMWDWSNGKDDSTALVDWKSNDNVIVLDLGRDLDNKVRGFAKMKLSERNDSLVIQFAMLEDQDFQEYVLGKRARYNRSFFSVESGVEEDIEPMRDAYDMVFRQYIFYFEEEDVPYSVVGGLNNMYGTRVLEILDKVFEDIELADTANYEFSDARDIVGYDWKAFDLNEGFYVVYPEMNWIIQTTEGFFYKFHFVDFYNTTGDRGYPKIEMKLL